MCARACLCLRDRDKISCNDRHSSFRFPFCPAAFYLNSVSTNGADQTNGGNATRSPVHSYSQTDPRTNTHPNPVFPGTSNINTWINTKHTCGCTPITSLWHRQGIETVIWYIEHVIHYIMLDIRMCVCVCFCSCTCCIISNNLQISLAKREHFCDILILTTSKVCMRVQGLNARLEGN